MQYGNNFHKDFVLRTLELAEHYESKYDATLLINCLLGLLLLPKESKTLASTLPDVPFEQLEEWGICKTSIILFRCDCDCDHKPNLKQLMRRLRNAVAHFNIELECPRFLYQGL